MDGFGEWLRVLREAKGWTLSDTERRSGIAQKYIQSLERGDIKEPDSKKLKGLANAYQVTLAEMLLRAYGMKPEIPWESLEAETLILEGLKKTGLYNEEEARFVTHWLMAFKIIVNRRKGAHAQ